MVRGLASAGKRVRELEALLLARWVEQEENSTKPRKTGSSRKIKAGMA